MKKYYLSALLFTVFACGSKSEATRNTYAPEAKMDKVPQLQKNLSFERESEEIMSSSAARPGLADSVHQFIRTADLKFKARDVIQSSFTIEDVVAENQGYIEHSRIESEVKERQLVKCSKDSAWNVTKFMTSNLLTARVPVEKLDQTLKSLRPLAVYLDYRTIDASNIAFDVYINELKQQRIAAHIARTENFSAKDQAATADQLLERQLQSDNAKVENMRQMDKVLYSTINIYMYQNEEVSTEKVPFFEKIEPYDSGFGSQFMESLHVGWQLLEFLFLLAIKSWSLLLILLVVFVLIRWRKRPVAKP